MTYALIIYGPQGSQTHEHVFDPEVEGEVCDGHSLCGKAMSWGDRLMSPRLAERGTPPCPDCLAAYAALRLRTEDGPECWFCGGLGKYGPYGSRPGQTCPECDGRGYKPKHAGIGG